MIYKIKSQFTLSETSVLLQLINKSDNFSYELSHLTYSIEYLNFLINQDGFVCILVYESNSFSPLFENNLIAFLFCNTKNVFIKNKLPELNKEFQKITDIQFDVIEELANIENESENKEVTNKNEIKELTNIKNDNKIIEEFDIKKDVLIVNLMYVSKESNSFKLFTNLHKFIYDNFIHSLLVTNKQFIKQFTKKYYYYRPLNFDILQKMKILYIDSPTTDIFTKVYKTFSYPINFNSTKIIKYNKIIDDSQILDLYNTFNTNLHENYDLFKEITLDDFKEIFKNDCFSKFFIYDSNTNKITDFVCFLNSFFTIPNTFLYCKNAQYYMGIYLNKNIQYKYNIIDYIAKYIKENELFDIITVCDDLSKYKNISTKFLKSIKKQYFSHVNLNLQNTNPKFVYL